ncbi:MAG: hypothetical protein OEL20_12835 [Sulfuritalea sp.]|nr:hypothetical protein [Sulfuritalea sp.]
MTKANPTRAARKSNRARPPIVIKSINKPDPDITAQAILPLLFDWLKRDRAKRGGTVDPGTG